MIQSYLSADKTFTFLLSHLIQQRGQSIKLKSGIDFEIINYGVELKQSDNSNKINMVVKLVNPMGHVLETNDLLTMKEFMDLTNDSLAEKLDWMVERLYKQLPNTEISKKLYAE